MERASETATATSSEASASHTTIRRVPGEGRGGYEFDFNASERPVQTAALPHYPSLAYNGKRSLSNIAIQAAILGGAFAISINYTIQFAWIGSLLWRPFAFVICLAVFHFLEFWTTARFNLPVCQADSFLLFTNGAAYNIAYIVAMAETLASALLFQDYATTFTDDRWKAFGLALIVFGQLIRSAAMIHAGTNFNHIPQKTRKEGHVLVTSGIYGWLRHPSYFGFFWWAIGTQLLIGNKFCTIAYAAVLWRFFQTRIKREEISLVDFFGEEYTKFKARTMTGIPFIR